MPGSVDAFVLDRELAIRLDDEDRKEQDEPMTGADAVDAVPSYDESQLPDVFGTPPPELGRL